MIGRKVFLFECENILVVAVALLVPAYRTPFACRF